MLEIPESHVISAQLDQTLRGKTIAQVVADASPHGFAFYLGDPSAYPGLLTGKTITGVYAVAGLVEMAAQEMRLVFSDGVNLRSFDAGQPLPAKHQLAITFDDGASLVCTVQMYGGLWVFVEGENHNPYYLVAREKPLPLADEFDEAYFQTLLASVKPTLAVKPFLATEQRIPGLGNGVLQDILFNAKVNPKSKLAALSESDQAALFQSIKQTLALMIAQGGRDTEKDLFGRNGGYRTLMSKNTLHAPCPVCGSTIFRQSFLGGNVYYCPACQPIKQ